MGELRESTPIVFFLNQNNIVLTKKVNGGDQLGFFIGLSWVNPSSIFKRGPIWAYGPKSTHQDSSDFITRIIMLLLI